MTDRAEREALSWFQRYPGLLTLMPRGECGGESLVHATTIVRAALARDIPAPIDEPADPPATLSTWHGQLRDATTVVAFAIEESISEFVSQRVDERGGGFEADPSKAARVAVDALVSAGWRPAPAVDTAAQEVPFDDSRYQARVLDPLRRELARDEMPWTGCGDTAGQDESRADLNRMLGEYKHDDCLTCGTKVAEKPLSMGERGLCNGVESCQHGIAWNNGCRACAILPDDLPETLATVEDVRQVCRAANLTEASEQEWGRGTVAVYTGLRRGASLRSVVVERAELVDDHRSGVRVSWSARFYPGAPVELLWHAIVAARSTP